MRVGVAMEGVWPRLSIHADPRAIAAEIAEALI
jgi:hypothetical protein